MELEAKIQQQIEDLQQIHMIEQHLHVLKEDIIEAENDLNQSLKTLNKEYKDVEVLEERTAIMLFHKLKGTLDNQIEKEKEEYYEAFLQTKEARKAIDILEFEEKVLFEKLQRLKEKEPGLRAQLQKLLSRREKSISKFEKDKKEKIRQLNKRLETNYRAIKEMQQVLQICFEMMQDLNTLHINIFELKQNQLVYSLKKPNDFYHKVEEISLAFRRLNNKRRRLKKELSELFAKVPTQQIKALIKKSNQHTKLIKHIIPPKFLDSSLNQKKFRNVALLVSLEEIEKTHQNMDDLYVQINTELDYFLLLNDQIKEEKAKVLLP